jgi:hypothetical protein
MGLSWANHSEIMMTLGHLTDDRFDQETAAIESVKIYVSYKEETRF